MRNKNTQSNSADISTKPNLSTMYYRCQNDTNWSMLQVSDSCQEILGCTSEKLISNEITLGEMIIESKKVWDSVQLALNNKTPFHLIYHIKTLSNKEKIIVDQGQGIFSKNNKLVEVQGFITDITQLFSTASITQVQQYFEALSMEVIQLSEKINNCKTLKTKLSAREIEILVHLCQGMTMKEIGSKLEISPRTIEMHINRLKLKLLCNNKSELRKLFFMTETGKKLVAIM